MYEGPQLIFSVEPHKNKFNKGAEKQFVYGGPLGGLGGFCPHIWITLPKLRGVGPTFTFQQL